MMKAIRNPKYGQWTMTKSIVKQQQTIQIQNIIQQYEQQTTHIHKPLYDQWKYQNMAMTMMMATTPHQELRRAYGRPKRKSRKVKKTSKKSIRIKPILKGVGQYFKKEKKRITTLASDPVPNASIFQKIKRHHSIDPNKYEPQTRINVNFSDEKLKEVYQQYYKKRNQLMAKRQTYRDDIRDLFFRRSATDKKLKTIDAETSAQYYKSYVYNTLNEMPNDVPEVVCIGRSNVGKSSLIAAILNAPKLVKRGNTPGHTQMVNYFSIANHRFHLVDCPGYGFAKGGEKQRKALHLLIKSYLMHRAPTNYQPDGENEKAIKGKDDDEGKENKSPLKMVYVLIDGRRLSLRQTDRQYIKLLISLNMPFTIVLTKCDQIPPDNISFAIAKLLDEIHVLGCPEKDLPMVIDAQVGAKYDLKKQRNINLLRMSMFQSCFIHNENQLSSLLHPQFFSHPLFTHKALLAPDASSTSTTDGKEDTTIDSVASMRIPKGIREEPKRVLNKYIFKPKLIQKSRYRSQGDQHVYQRILRHTTNKHKKKKK